MMLVFVLMSGGANAHGITDMVPIAAHDHSRSQNDHHALHQTLPDAQYLSTQVNTAAPAEAHQIDTCSHSHCSHNYAAGLITAYNAYMTAGAMTAVSTSGASWASSAITDNIERPKWLSSTPAVVSLLT